MKLFIYQRRKNEGKTEVHEVEVKETNSLYKVLNREYSLPGYRATISKKEIGALNAHYSRFEMALTEREDDLFLNAILIHTNQQIETYKQKIAEEEEFKRKILTEVTE